MSSVLVLGATGLCGGAFLKFADSSAEVSKVYALTRRPLTNPQALKKTENIVDTNPSGWTKILPTADILFSSLSTTKGNAGGFDQQYKIDHDLNIELAKQAKANGTRTFIIVSSTGASPESMFPYLRMKGEIERDILALDFDKTIILRPGPLVGERDNNLKGLGNTVVSKFGGLFYNSFISPLFSYPAQGLDVGKVGLEAALKLDNGVHIIGSSEVVEWSHKGVPSS